MRILVIVMLWLLCIPAQSLAHIEVSSSKDIDHIGTVRTCKNGIRSVAATIGVVKMWALQKFGDQTSIVLAEREEIQTNL